MKKHELAGSISDSPNPLRRSNMRLVSSRYLSLIIAGALFATLGGATLWMVLGWADDTGSVSIRFMGATNFNERTFVLFAITNRLATNIRGAAFQINFVSNQWVDATRPLNSVTTPGRRDMWLDAAGRPNSGIVHGVIPTSSNTWRMVFGIPHGGARKIPWRNRLTIYLYQHRFPRLAAWVRPRVEKGWTPQDYHGEAVLGPKMQGTRVQ
jgi:hypothetical protein